MATAKFVPSVPLKPSVILELSFEEAQAVCLILGKITGLTETTPRKYTDEVYWALDDLLGAARLIWLPRTCFSGPK